MVGDAGFERLVRAHTRIGRAGLVPEFALYLADAVVPLWQAVERQAAAPQPPPFWAFAWPGSQALARYLLDTPTVVAGKRVLDFGAGGGLAAIAAAHIGASHVLACDVDAYALLAQRLNAALNGVRFEQHGADLVGSQVEADVLLAGDVCYERQAAERHLSWMRAQAGRGVEVILADPGRSYAPATGVELLATYDVETLVDLESLSHKTTRVWRLLPA